MKIRVLIVDDEKPARSKIRTYLEREPGAEIAAEAQNGLEAVDAIRNLAPDLIFLDIQMPGMSGFEVIDAVGVDAMPATIFVTAHDEFALQAFEVEAVDYLLKPFEEERFRKAFDRALGRIEARTKDGGQITRVLERALPGNAFLQRVVVRDGGRLFFVNVEDILWLSAQENYVEIHTGSRTHLIRDSLSHLEGRLDPGKFARIHRSEIVNVDSIQELKSWSHGDYIVLLKNGTSLRLSRRYQHRLLHPFE